LEAPVAARPGDNLWQGLKGILLKYDTVWALIALSIVAALASDRFLQLPNLINIGRQVSIIGIAAIGATLVIITAGIDLSVGPVIVLGSMVIGLLQHQPMALAIAAALAAGAACGWVNGLLVAKLRIPAFIVTFGMMGVYGGLAYITSTGIRVVIENPAWYYLGSGQLWGFVPVPLAIYLVTALLGSILLTRTVFGTYVYGMGVNETALRFAGVRVDFHKVLVYTIAGFTAGLAGIVLAGRLREADPGLVFAFTLDVIAAVVLGGTKLEGGYGNIFRTVVGSLIIGVVNNAMNLLNVSSYYQQSVKGALIILALAVTLRRNQ